MTSLTPAVTRSAEQRRGARRVGAVLFLATFLVFLATASRGYLCLDVWSSNLASYQLATTGTPYLDGVERARSWTAPRCGGCASTTTRPTATS